MWPVRNSSGFRGCCALYFGGWKRFWDRAASIFKVEFRDQGDVSTAWLPNYAAQQTRNQLLIFRSHENLEYLYMIFI
jgi:hypothetical protein